MQRTKTDGLAFPPNAAFAGLQSGFAPEGNAVLCFAFSNFVENETEVFWKDGCMPLDCGLP